MDVSDSQTASRFWLIVTVPICLLLAVAFLLTRGGTGTAGSRPAPVLQPAWYMPELPREKERKNAVMVGNCFLCHAFWVRQPPDPTVRQPRFAHVAIRLDHGSNDRCYNCHLINDRNKFVRNDGSGIMPETPEQVCRRCHGLIYNDWKNGTHGVRRGKWLVQGRFDQEIFTCTNCHDPHSPRFRFTDFAPAPTWPAKFIRKGRVENEGGAYSEFIVGPEPKEMF